MKLNLIFKSELKVLSIADDGFVEVYVVSWIRPVVGYNVADNEVVGQDSRIRIKFVFIDVRTEMRTELNVKHYWMISTLGINGERH